jgi:hypothetical protein
MVVVKALDPPDEDDTATEVSPLENGSTDLA